MSFKMEYQSLKQVSKKRISLPRQCFATGCMGLVSFSFGTSCGWPSAALPLLEDSRSNVPITTEEASWIASMLCLGGLAGTLLFGVFSAKIGRKGALYIAAILQIIGWLLVYYAASPFHLLLSRFVAGVAGGSLFINIPSYISDIASDEVRGALGSTFVLSINVGVLCSFICGNYVDYLTLPWIFMAPSIVFLIFFFKAIERPSVMYRETKQPLLQFKGLSWYSGDNGKQQIDLQLQPVHLDCETFNCFNSKHAWKALIYSVCLMAFSQLCGCFALINFTATIFKDAGSNLSPNSSAIIIGGIQLLGSFVPLLFVDRLGRKFMLAISAAGTSFGLCILGTYAMVEQRANSIFNWIPLAAFSFIILTANFGILTIPYLYISEISHPKIRMQINLICISILWLAAFVVVKYTTTLIAYLGLHGLMFLFAFNSFVMLLFVAIVPETKGKSIEEIVDLLEN